MSVTAVSERENIPASFPVLNAEAMLADFAAYVDAGKRTVETYTKGIRAFISYIQRQGIGHPEREDVISFREYLRQTLKPSTIKTYLAGLRRFFSWLEMRGLWKDITQGVKGVKLDKGFKKDALTSNQVKELLAAIDTSTAQGKRDYAMIALMVTTGLRDIEVSRALISDIRPVGDSTVLFIQGKGRTEKAEYVKLPQPVEKAIRVWLAERNNISSGDPLFSSISNNNMGGALSTRSISGIVKGAMRLIGLDSDRLTAHSCRHFAATTALIEGSTLQEVQQMMRHSSIITTQIYAHNLERMNNHSEERISHRIFG